MLYNSEKLIPFVHGARDVELGEQGIRPSRFTQEEYAFFQKKDGDLLHRARYSSGCTMEFKTKARHLKLSYFTAFHFSLDSFDLYVNGTLFASMNQGELPMEGTLSWDLPEGDKTVYFYFPVDTELWVSNLEAEDVLEPLPRHPKIMLVLGDSITQGFGSFKGSLGYISCFNRLHPEYEIYNLGLGAYAYDAGCLLSTFEPKPEEIILAHGTNQHLNPHKKEDIEGFFKRFFELYPDTHTTVITPLWRDKNGSSQEELARTRAYITACVEGHEQVTLLRGEDMIPAEPSYYWDCLHPNEKGSIYFAEQVSKAF